MSESLLIVERPERWPFEQLDREMPGVELVSARAYLTDSAFAGRRGLRVFNLCRSYRYQSLGYYVSLLAEARGHKPLPSVATIQDLKSPSLVRFISEDVEDRIRKSLAPLSSDQFTLSIYFGRNLAERYRKLALQLFNFFPAPLLRAQFTRQSGDGQDGGWHLQSLRAIGVRDVPEEHRDFLAQAAREYFSHREPKRRARSVSRYDLAILVNPKDKDTAPSDERAIQRFCRAAAELGIGTDLITRDDYGHLAKYDALFIRELTLAHNHTYRFASRAAAEGLVVIDDPQSILRCSNKVFLAETLERIGVRMPRTAIVHRDNLETVVEPLGWPVILKLPDGSFSTAVSKLDDLEAFRAKARELLEESDLLIAQEFLPTDFDWRIGVLGRKILFAARYAMVRGHWQIALHQGRRTHYGGTEAVAEADVPPFVLAAALASAGAIGDGLYGVDVKEKDGKAYVIEVNDNPNLDADCEDRILGEELYRRLARFFLERIERGKEGKG